MFASVFSSVTLTEDVGLKVVVFNESHIAVTFTGDVSNQTPPNNDSIKDLLFLLLFQQQNTRCL